MTDETSSATTTDDHNYLKIMQYNVNKRREVVDSILNDTQIKDYSLLLIQEQYRIKPTNSPPIHQSWTLIEPTTQSTTPPHTAVYINNRKLYPMAYEHVLINHSDI